MDLLVNVGRNQITINGRAVAGRHRWEAATLALLIEAAEAPRQPGVSAQQFDEYFRTLGQASPLDRTGRRRLLHSLGEMFARVGEHTGFQLRFRHLPRQGTVGPWHWCNQPGDTCEVFEPLGVPVAASLPVHRFAADGNLAASLRIAHKLAVCHALWGNGSKPEAVEAFESGDEWALAAPEILVHRAIFAGDTLAGCGRFEEAEIWFDDARALMDAHPTAGDQATLLWLTSKIAKVVGNDFPYDAQAHCAVEEFLASRTGRSPHVDLDYRARSFAYTYLAKSELINALQSGLDRCDSIAVLRTLCDHNLSSAVMGLLGCTYDWVCYGMQGLVLHQLPFLSHGVGGLATNMLDAHQCAIHWRQAFEPPDGFSMLDFAGAMLLHHAPELGAEVSRRIANRQWFGEWRPDAPDAYLRLLATNSANTDPFWRARHVAAAMCLTARRRLRSEHRRLHGELQAITAQHPYVKARLVMDGYYDDATIELIRVLPDH